MAPGLSRIAKPLADKMQWFVPKGKGTGSAMLFGGACPRCSSTRGPGTRGVAHSIKIQSPADSGDRHLRGRNSPAAPEPVPLHPLRLGVRSVVRLSFHLRHGLADCLGNIVQFIIRQRTGRRHPRGNRQSAGENGTVTGVLCRKLPRSLTGLAHPHNGNRHRGDSYENPEPQSATTDNTLVECTGTPHSPSHEEDRYIYEQQDQDDP